MSQAETLPVSWNAATNYYYHYASVVLSIEREILLIWEKYVLDLQILLQPIDDCTFRFPRKRTMLPKAWTDARDATWSNEELHAHIKSPGETDKDS
jgi:hypothetical protein